MKALLPAILTKITSRKDKSYSLTFDTRELRGNEAATLLDNLLSEGWLLWSPNEDLAESDAPTEKADALMGTKTPSQRLRNVLYIRWQQRGQNGKFEDYYRSALEAVIEQIKETLEDE